MMVFSRTKIQLLTFVMSSFLLLHTNNLLADEGNNTIQVTLISYEYPNLPKKQGCRFKFKIKNNTDIFFREGIRVALYSMEDKKHPIMSRETEKGPLKPNEAMTGNIDFRMGCRHVLYGPIKIRLLVQDGWHDSKTNCGIIGVYRRVTPTDWVLREFNLLVNTEDHSIMLHDTHETNNGNKSCWQ